MAEGLLRNLLPEKFQEAVVVSSAGTDALHGNWATDYAIKVMQEYDIDISSHRARLLNRQMIASADLILAMEQYHLKVIRSLKSFTGSKSFLLSTFDRSRRSFDSSRTSFDNSNAPYDVPDPIGGDLSLYRESAELIHGCLAGVYAYLEEKHEI
jgi:protein-tyrosine phosphatase